MPYLLALGILTYRQVGYWHDTESFWRRTLALAPDNTVAHTHFAGILRQQGKEEEAIEHIRAAVAIRPDDSKSRLILGDYERVQGNLAEAIEQYQFVALHSGSVGYRAKAYVGLGFAYYKMGQAMKAQQNLENSLQLVPDQPAVMVNLGLFAQRQSDLPEAVRQYTRALALQPSDVGCLLLANALHQEGRDDEAREMFRRATILSWDLPKAQREAEGLLAGR